MKTTHCPFCQKPFFQKAKNAILLLSSYGCNNCPGYPTFYVDELDNDTQEDSITFRFWDEYNMEYYFTYLFYNESFYLTNDAGTIFYETVLQSVPQPKETEDLFNRIMKHKAFI